MLTARRGNIAQICIEAVIRRYALGAEELRMFNQVKKAVRRKINEKIFDKNRTLFPRICVLDHQPWTRGLALKCDALKVEVFISPNLPDKSMRSAMHAMLPASRRRLKHGKDMPGSHVRYHCEAFEDSVKAGISGPSNLLFNCKMTFCDSEEQWSTSIRAAKGDITGQPANVQLAPEGLKAFTALRLVRDKMQGLNQLKDWHLTLLVQSANPPGNGAEQPAGITVLRVLDWLRSLEKGEDEDWPFNMIVGDLVLLELDEESFYRMKRDANYVFRNPTHLIRGMEAIDWHSVVTRF